MLVAGIALFLVLVFGFGFLLIAMTFATRMNASEAREHQRDRQANQNQRELARLRDMVLSLQKRVDTEIDAEAKEAVDDLLDTVEELQR